MQCVQYMTDLWKSKILDVEKEQLSALFSFVVYHVGE